MKETKIATASAVTKEHELNVLEMDYIKINQQAWDQCTPLHVESRFYDVKGFLAGNTSLQEIELAELKSLIKRLPTPSLLHLQCHFGLDSLSWARLGADVTGIDLSPVAIEAAQSLASKAHINAQFICANLFDAVEATGKKFDIVYTSYGALVWLPDLDLWAQTVANSLTAGGVFYMVEFHPAHSLFEGYRYFHHREADVDIAPTYTENAGDAAQTSMTWSHSLSDVINALLKVGISIEVFNEFDFSPYDCFEDLQLETNREGRTKRYIYETDKGQRVPLTYSILGKKLV